MTNKENASSDLSVRDASYYVAASVPKKIPDVREIPDVGAFSQHAFP